MTAATPISGDKSKPIRPGRRPSARWLAQVVFAITMIGIGLYGFASGGYTGSWEPGPKGPERQLVADLCALVATGTGLGLLSRRTAAFAAGLLTAYVLAWTLIFRAPALPVSPATVEESCGESAVLAAAAWVLLVWSTGARPSRYVAAALDARGLRWARTLYGLALIAFGAAHFAYPGPTAGLIPDWLPAHETLVLFTGATYVLAGLAILADTAARLAAALATAQIGLFTALVWGPHLVSGPPSAGQLSEGILSWSLTISSWVVALSYRTEVRDGVST